MTTTVNTASLKATYDALLAERGSLRAREAAAELGVTEAELVDADCVGTSTRLDTSWLELLRSIGRCGRVMALTRNDACVHERKGVYTGVGGDGPHLLVVGPDIDLRLFPSQWAAAWKIVNTTSRGVQHSVQVFDAYGMAVHKIFATEETDLEAWNHELAMFERPADEFRPESSWAAVVDRRDADIDVAGLRAEWEALKDTHDFFPVLRKYKVGRLQALRLVGAPLAIQVPVSTIASMLACVSPRAIPIMCFVGNDGAIQIHTGTVHRIVEHGPWLNVMDPDFNLHLRIDAVASVWLVTKPTEDGPVHSIECFDAANGMVVQFFGARKPGKPELSVWIELWNELREGAAR